MSDAPTIHASAVLVGAKAILIRGPSGAGKSRLAWELLNGTLPFSRLVADDRALIEARAGRLLVRPAPALSGLIEVHGLGIRRLPFESVAVVALLVDLAAADAARHPAREASQTSLEGVALPRLAVAPGQPAFPLVLAVLGTPPAGI